MKTMILSLSASLVFLAGAAQNNTSGKVIYEETVKLDIQLKGENAQFASLIPKEKKSEMVLYFTPEASLYRSNNQQKEEESVNQDISGGEVVVKMIQPDDKYFTDLKERKTIEQRDFMSRLFLIVDDITARDWKITGNQQMILGYPCQEATRQEDDKKIIVWFTSAIPVPAGPARYIDLPGLILSVDMNNGERTIMAKSVELAQVDKALLQKPDSGKKISSEKFKKLVDEKRKEMQEQYGSSGGAVIQIQQQ